MSKVFEICIANKSGSGMIKIPSVDVVAKKGIINEENINFSIIYNFIHFNFY